MKKIIFILLVILTSCIDDDVLPSKSDGYSKGEFENEWIHPNDTTNNDTIVIIPAPKL